VLPLKLKESNGLAIEEQRESPKEFNSCPVLGGTAHSDAAASSY
jgi:hypothetical protein